MRPTAPPIEKRSYRPAEIAQRNSISERTVYNLIAAGKLQAAKIGRATVITAEAESAWLASLPACPHAAA